MIPGGLPGLLQLEGTCYMVTPHAGSADVFVLVKTDGTAYVVDTHRRRCSCPDATFKRRECKHVRGITAAMAALWANEQADDERDPFEGATEEEKRFWLGLDDAPSDPTPPAGPAALPMPARKPNHNFVADVA
jgi:hypothetical protein